MLLFEKDERGPIVEEVHFRLKQRIDNPPDYQKNLKLKCVTTLEEAHAVVMNCCEKPFIGFDTETSGLDFRYYKGENGERKSKDKIAGVCLAPTTTEGFYLPVGHERGQNLPLNEVIDLLKMLVESPTQLVMHNAAFDLKVLYGLGIDIRDPEKFFDTFLAFRIADVTRHADELGLKHLAKIFLKWEMLEFFSMNKVKMGKKTEEVKFSETDSALSYVYAADDPLACMALKPIVENEPYFDKQKSIFLLERKFAIVLGEVLQNRVHIDKTYLLEGSAKIDEARIKCQAKLNELAGQEINVSSQTQLSPLLFEKFKLPTEGVLKGKKGYSTDASTLERLKGKHPIVDYVIEYRSYVKDHGTYILPLLSDTDENGDISVRYWQIGADTGRLTSSAGDYNKSGEVGLAIMTIPKWTPADPKIGKMTDDFVDFRRAFIARDSYYYVSIDYAGEELRIWTNLSGEPVWTKMFQNDEDLHRRTASWFFGIPEDQITSEQRAAGKSSNFLIVYGGSAWTLAADYKLSNEKAEKIYGRIFGELKAGRAWMDSMQDFAKKNGYSFTYFGRIRPLPDATSKEFKKMLGAMRQAVNHPVQGTGADVMKLVMISLDNMLRTKGWSQEWNQDARMLLTLHDEIAFEIRKEKIHEILPEIMRVMEGVKGKDWKVTLKTEASVGYSWSKKSALSVLYEDGHLLREKDVKKIGKIKALEAAKNGEKINFENEVKGLEVKGVIEKEKLVKEEFEQIGQFGIKEDQKEGLIVIVKQSISREDYQKFLGCVKSSVAQEEGACKLSMVYDNGIRVLPEGKILRIKKDSFVADLKREFDVTKVNN